MFGVVASGKGPASVLSVAHNLTRPTLSAGDVLIRVVATAINRADILQRKGAYPPPPGASSILGLEAAGVVEEVAQPSPFAVGDRVAALLTGGGYASHCIAPSGCVFPVPKSVPLTVAAAVPEAFLTAYQTLFVEARLTAGESVLIHAAASGVGTAAAQLALHSGVSKVILTCSQSKVEELTELMRVVCVSADRPHDTVVILARDSHLKTGDDEVARFAFAETVRAVTNGRGVDVILDPVFGSAYASEHVDCIAVGGRWVVIATMGGPNLDGVVLGKLLRSRASILFSTLRARSVEYKTALVNGFVRDFGSRLSAAAGVRAVWPAIHATIPLDEVVRAHELVESNTTIGKVVLVVDPAALVVDPAAV